jgi:hypothetical protein
MRVNGGVGTMILGHLDLFLSGPQSVLGRLLVLWMDAIHPSVNSTNSLMSGNSNGTIGCAIIMPDN